MLRVPGSPYASPMLAAIYRRHGSAVETIELADWDPGALQAGDALVEIEASPAVAGSEGVGRVVEHQAPRPETDHLAQQISVGPLLKQFGQCRHPALRSTRYGPQAYAPSHLEVLECLLVSFHDRERAEAGHLARQARAPGR